MKSKRPLSFLIVASLSIGLVLPVLDVANAFQPPGAPGGPAPSMPEDPAASMSPMLTDPGFMMAASSRPSKPVTTGNAHNIRPNPTPSKCLMLAREIGASRVWWGRHVGAKEIDDNDLLFSFGPRRVEFDDIGCFRTKKDCQNWLYWKRTEYPIFASISPCRRGL
ncbi:hypothetical protein [uncultured Cohaesibacter sp.]|uniref:hypothetical protein n=1 Tax=uncultured Cohaesibacter sp. TaxID=1002546 RepID=UPI0029C80CA3|nr:hypothetical protein [uncultured Cohaesibacter sp.]